jgi:hypothetical protein
MSQRKVKDAKDLETNELIDGYIDLKGRGKYL